MLHGPFNVSNVSAVSTLGTSLEVYWDQGCSKTVPSIDWGNVSVGSEKDNTVFVKNLGSSALILSMNTSEWSSSSAYQKIYLCWDYGGQSVGSLSVVRVTLKLFVSPSISGVRSFSFKINLGAGLGKSPDINGDGNIDVSDAALLGMAWGTRAGDSKYNYRCDLNNDGTVDIADATILARTFHK